MDNSFPAELAKLRHRFEHWRNTCSARSPIPADLLQAARGLLGRYPISWICRACRLHPNSLRKPATVNARSTAPVEAANKSAASTAPDFYALPEPPVLAANSACRLVLERPDGARLTLTLPRLDVASLASLCSDFLRS